MSLGPLPSGILTKSQQNQHCARSMVNDCGRSSSIQGNARPTGGFSISLSFSHPAISLPLPHYLSHYLSFCFSIYIFFFLCLSPSLPLALCLPPPLSLSLSLSFTLFLGIYFYWIYLFLSPSRSTSYLLAYLSFSFVSHALNYSFSHVITVISTV